MNQMTQVYPQSKEPQSWVERRWLALPAWVRAAVTVLVYVISYQLLDWAARVFTPASEVAVWYPASALNVVLLWVFGLRYAPAIFLAVCVSEILTSFELELFMTLVYALIQMLGYAGVVLFLRALEVNPRLYTLYDRSRFLVATTLLPLLFVAVLGVTTLALAGAFSWDMWLLRVMQFWAGDATGIGLLAPPLLIALRLTPWLWTDDLWANDLQTDDKEQSPQLRLPTRREWVLGGALFTALVLCTVLAYRGERGSVNLNRDYIAFVPLVAVAVWYGFEITAFAVLFANIIIAALVGPSFGGSDDLALQFGLMTLTLVSLALGAIISARQETETELRYRTRHDPLTGLPNRELLLERLGEAQDDQALLMLNLDNFQNVNDSLGHDFGDELLRAVARRLGEGLPPGDTLAHLSGDEFVLLTHVDDRRDTVQVSRGMREAFAQPFYIQGREQRLSVGIGVALIGDLAPREEEPAPTEMLRRAHTALHQAKKRGKAHTVLFEEAMHAQAVERLELENDLRRALEYREFVVHYQPIWSLKTGHIVKAEALLRWPHSERGMIPPATFIPLAEETGLIAPLSRWLMRTAFKQAKVWRSEGHALTIAVNVSAAQVRTDLTRTLDELLEGSALAPEHVCLEVTESLFLEPREDTVTLLRQLNERGVEVSVDDFGTGYSSLSYLKNLPIRTLKIDRSFLRGVPGDAGDVAIVETILFMADALGLNVTAEGVETKAQVDFLLAQGCDHAQGYYLGCSLSAAAFASYLGRSVLNSR